MPPAFNSSLLPFKYKYCFSLPFSSPLYISLSLAPQHFYTDEMTYILTRVDGRLAQTTTMINCDCGCFFAFLLFFACAIFPLVAGLKECGGVGFGRMEQCERGSCQNGMIAGVPSRIPLSDPDSKCTMPCYRASARE